MSISSRFSVGIHILSLLDVNKHQSSANTSEFLATSVNTNPAVIRKIIGMLRNEGLVKTKPGIAGAELAKDLSQVTLLDVYKAVHAVKDNELFNIHDNPNPKCMVGRNIQHSIAQHFSDAQRALEEKLESITVDQVVSQIVKDEIKIE
ncbi:Rrf2 family transcriptional regulator [Alkalicoccobacillus murimartini]|uniref:DNA-binding IscR family transcriptional regulator n=1 Tax=Alkalicoccobacillus murimartini TaxID=171685 RepID=A0ABT9YHA5_9BACI|nr:Rrf2 family transcriptional regulator [Alkalicoccobacillus murimartini]MDQ0207230.1 DNA-binding IscR family transcriptional regulator [Alkalicoccobacillus murimartini]